MVMFRRKEAAYRENLELSLKLKEAELRNVLKSEQIAMNEETWKTRFQTMLIAKDGEIAAWKDRGDRYANHNNSLEAHILEIHKIVLANDPQNHAAVIEAY